MPAYFEIWNMHGDGYQVVAWREPTAIYGGRFRAFNCAGAHSLWVIPGTLDLSK